MKKFLALLICFVLLLSACSASGNPSETQTNSSDDEISQSSYAPRPYFTDYVLNAYMGS